ncbi:hypothetical protein F4774DRAFT_303115 [Daldinia eschscholtzii]|nr:hypothetical protein F4774DRAFT_303115 [Daldinia eschscholtzii]
MSSIAQSAENMPSLLIRMVMPYGVPTFRCPFCTMWFQKPGHLKNHLSKQHTAELAQVGIFLTVLPDTSNWMFEGMGPLLEHPSPIQPQNNMSTASGNNAMGLIPVPGSSQASGPAPPSSNKVASQSTQFSVASPPHFSPPLPQFQAPLPPASSRSQRFTPAPQASSIVAPPPPPVPATQAPPSRTQTQSLPMSGTFQPNNHAVSTMNGSVASPGMPPPPANNPYGNASTQNLSGFNQWQF